MAGQHRIVVAIDFGTTYSALAWASTSSPNHISLIGNWPSVGTRTHHSAPTEISYSIPGNTTDFQWGYDIAPNQRRLKWFKLLLETDDERVQSSVPIPDGLTPTDVTRDFLSALYKHTMDTLWRHNSAAVMSAMKVDFVLTVPAVWSDAAKNRTRKAAEDAGIGREHDLQLLSEPEAAAIYSFKVQETGSVNVGDRIVVCDAGGGTVDLVSYAVVALHPDLRVTECAVGNGEFAGSTYIDRNWEALLKQRLGQHYSYLRPENQQRAVKNFEEVKCAFEDRPEKERFYVSIPTMDTIDEPGVRVRDGELEITREELRGLFDPIVNEVIKLVSAQVAASSEGGRYKVNSILLVGGFGESKYLFKRLKDWGELYGIETLQPRDAATAVVKGAVIRGLATSMGAPTGSVVRLARRHYGTPMSAPFIEGRHNPADAYIDPITGQKMAQGQISWFIRKGEQLSDDRKISRAFKRTFRKYSGPWLDAMVACDLDVPPTRITPDVKNLCIITADLSNIRKACYERRWKNWKRYYIARYTLELTISSGDMWFELMFGGASYGNCKLDFGSAPGRGPRGLAEVPG